MNVLALVDPCYPTHHHRISNFQLSVTMQTPGFTAPAALPVSSSRLEASLCSRGCRTAFFPARSLPSFRAASRRLSAKKKTSPFATASPPIKDVSVVLLAGGSGSRMKADRPKQFLQLAGRPVVHHSVALFSSMPEVAQLIVVVAEAYRPDFTQIAAQLGVSLTFADPGKERQDSVFNGLSAVVDGASVVCIHDAARPLVTAGNVREVLRDGIVYGAAVLGVPSKATIKESADGQFVLRTIERKRLWEIQTPQVVKPEVLRRGFEKVRREGLDVTDDVSIVEQLGEPVKLTMGEYTNIKLTTPEDMNIAESILKEREAAMV